MTQPNPEEDCVILSPAGRARVMRLIREMIRNADARAAAASQPDDLDADQLDAEAA
jgi:hypothetical protein